jgi:hypothetical protein
LKSLEHQIQHIETNIPSRIQEYINSELPQNIKNQYQIGEYMNNTLNNITISRNDNKRTQIFRNIKSYKKILFSDLEIPQIHSVTEAEFIRIPKYIIGRYALEILNNLVSNINEIIKTKYSIINLSKQGTRKKGQLDLYLHYKKEQANFETKDGMFINNFISCI